MAEAKLEKTIEVAVKLGFLSDSQLQVIEKENAKSNHPQTEIAVRKGFLSRNQIDLLSVFSNPLNVVPGYRIDGLIGRGGVGVVFKATQLRMDRSVAIKTINQAATRSEFAPKRFEREAQIVGQLRHPNIVSAYDYGIHNQQLYLVMEFVDGIDGEKFLEEGRQSSELDAWYIARQVCHALNYANQTGIIHRDIKPGNLIFTTAPSGSQLPPQVPFVKIADFGLARFTDNTTESQITMESSVSGTPFYMSPEQVVAEEIDHISDIYSLGITIWHLVMGQPPITGSGPLDVISQKMKLEDTWLESKPEHLSKVGFELFKKMCRHNRADRISDYSELVAEIDNVISELSSPSLIHSGSQFDSEKYGSEKFTASTHITYQDELEALLRNKGSSKAPLKSGYQPSQETQEFVRKRPPPANISTKQLLLTAIAIAALILGCLGAFSYWSSNPNHKKRPNVADLPSDERVRLQNFIGPPIFLFDGFKVDPRGLSPNSRWESGDGIEGGRILAGFGSKKFRCVDDNDEPLDVYRFSLGFRHHEADEIDAFLLDGNDEEQFRVIIEPTQCKVFVGDKEIDSCELELDDEGVGYLGFQIESQPGYWRIAIGADLVTEIPKRDDLAAVPSIQIDVKGEGSAHFDKVQFMRLMQFNPMSHTRLPVTK